MSRRSRRGPVECFPALSEGIQNGLRRLVGDNLTTIASMLDVSLATTDGIDNTTVLCEKCAHVMKQQQLSASSFLARFFPADILSQHSIDYLNKSGKGSAATLGDRIAAEWAKNNVKPRLPSSSSKNDATTTEKAETAAALEEKETTTKATAKKESRSDSPPERKRKATSEQQQPSPLAQQDDDDLVGRIPKKVKSSQT